MDTQKPTHRMVKGPQISARDLADYMAAGSRERFRRGIIRASKFRSTARVVQHDEAKATISNFFTQGNRQIDELIQRAEFIRNKIVDDDFEADANAHNADYLRRFAAIFTQIELPKHDAILAVDSMPPLTLNGVRVTVDLAFRLRRLTRTNKIRIGGGMLRYRKGKALPAECGEWQSAFLFGYLDTIKPEDAASPEHGLCATIDAYSGVVYSAPTDAVSRFHEMEAACATIAERWQNIEPPSGARL